MSIKDTAEAVLDAVMSILELPCPRCGTLLLRGLDQYVDMNSMLGKKCYSCGDAVTLMHVAGWMKQKALDKAKVSLEERTKAAGNG